MNQPGDTLSAVSLATGATGPEIIRSQAILIRNTFDEPIVLTVMIAPRMYHVYSVAIDPAEFRNALRQYGIDQAPKLNKIDL
jgi:hypothetical protein